MLSFRLPRFRFPFDALRPTTQVPKSITFDASVVAEVAAVPALAVGPKLLEEAFLWKQGEAVVQWLTSTLPAQLLQKAWAEVQRVLTAKSAQIYELLLAHPYTVTVGLAIVAGAFFVCLLRRKVADFMAITESMVDDTLKELEYAGKVPSHFFCPITMEVMKDPYITPSGHSYERSAIEQWIADKGTDPQTRMPLTVAQLIPNRGLKSGIEDWRRKLQDK